MCDRAPRSARMDAASLPIVWAFARYWAAAGGGVKEGSAAALASGSIYQVPSLPGTSTLAEGA